MILQPVLSSQNILTKGSDYKHVRSWLGDGLILSTGNSFLLAPQRNQRWLLWRVIPGNKWKCRRRLMTPAFHFKILENFMPVFSNQCHILEEQIEQRIQHCEGKAEIDVFPLFVRCTLDIICGKRGIRRFLWLFWNNLISFDLNVECRSCNGYPSQRTNRTIAILGFDH